jgi:hypothetical protein
MTSLTFVHHSTDSERIQMALAGGAAALTMQMARRQADLLMAASWRF